MVTRRVKDAGGNDGRRFGGHLFGKRVGTNLRELLHIARSDLIQRAVTRPVEIVVRIAPIPVVRLGGTRGKSYSAKARNCPEHDRQRQNKKRGRRDRSDGCCSNLESALTHFICPLSEIGTSG